MLGMPYFIQGKLMYHRTRFCGANAERTEKQSKQLKKGKKVDINIKKVTRKNKGSYNSDATHKGRSLLHNIKWNRIILDEVSCDIIMVYKMVIVS